MGEHGALCIASALGGGARGATDRCHAQERFPLLAGTMYHYAKVLTDSREPTTPGFGQSVHLTPVRQICLVGSEQGAASYS